MTTGVGEVRQTHSVSDVCTVMLRFDPAAPWPILLAAVRDEFTGRAWDPPGPYWLAQPAVIGGRDRVGGGTWMAVDPTRTVVAALLNGVRLPALPGGETRPTRGTLVLAALADDLSTVDGAERVPGIADAAALARYDGFHLLRARLDRVELWSWDGVELRYQHLAPGNHIVVNLGPDRDDDPLVPHFRPLLAATGEPPLLAGQSTPAAWGPWVDLMRGDGLDPTDERGLIIEHDVEGRRYGSTSASLVALGRHGDIRYDFTAMPATPDWYRVR